MVLGPSDVVSSYIAASVLQLFPGPAGVGCLMSLTCWFTSWVILIAPGVVFPYAAAVNLR